MKKTKKIAQKNLKPLRPTLWDDLEEGVKNLFCTRRDLTNEASVEAFFVGRLLRDLGYKDSQIETKKTLPFLTVGKGHKREKYRPDYALKVHKYVRCIIDAKGTDQDIDDWIEQCSGYCLALNRKYPADKNPVRFFILTNGIATKVYRWDSDEVLLPLDFSDFELGNAKFEQLKAILSPAKIIHSENDIPVARSANFEFIRPSREKARQLFSSCHNAIRKSGYGPAPAFMQFVKIMFVKLYADRQLRENIATKDILASGDDKVKLPAAAVTCSVRWIEEREKEGIVNPLDTITFYHLRNEIEKNIKLQKKKRLFDTDEKIGLRPDVVKSVIAKLEHFDMFGIDEDLNGRLFETFLNATMRGRELGQFFTPRSVVKMMTRLADIKVNRNHQDRVIDACCGSGGFLIEALTVMRNQVRANTSLSRQEQEKLLEVVCNERIYGIDFGEDPPIARIARVNMYLHGDGGSRIYATDGLDKSPRSELETDPEAGLNLREWAQLLKSQTKFDVVLANPPFSMTKDVKNETDQRILLQYDLAKRPEKAQLRPSLRASVMFIERYHDLLIEGGKLITVIDDTLLASNDFGYVRDYMRDKFLIRAIISLPGDTFRRSGSRVKTSAIFLEKKSKLSDQQPSCFAYFSEYLGVDDLVPRASEEDIREARQKAEAETEEILSGYKNYLEGKGDPLILTPEQIGTRLDLKFCVPMFGRMVASWKKRGVAVKQFLDCVKLIEDSVVPQNDPEKEFTLIKVTYDGVCVPEKVRKGKAVKPTRMYRVKAGQMVFSVIRATDGAIGIVPPELDGALVSDTSYVVFECDDPQDAAYLWAVLRSHELRADMQSLSPGSSRYVTPWPEVGEVLVPWLKREQRLVIGQRLIDAWELEKQVHRDREAAMEQIADLGVESEESIQRWRASKAPQ